MMVDFKHVEVFRGVFNYQTGENFVCANFMNQTCMVNGVIQDPSYAKHVSFYNGWLVLSSQSYVRISNVFKPEKQYIVFRILKKPGSDLEESITPIVRGISGEKVICSKNPVLHHDEPIEHSYEYLWYDMANNIELTITPKRLRGLKFIFYCPWGALFTSRDTIELYNDELELCWQLDLSMYKRPANNPWESVSKHTLGPWNDKLYVVVHYEKPNIMEIDPLSGAILREWGQLPEEHIYEVRGLKMYTLPHLERTFLDKEKNVLGCLSEIAYWEIDLLTGQFSMVNLQQMFEELKLSIICILYDPDYVYFTATSTPDIIYFEVAVQYVGAYNRHTHQIDWLRTAPDWSKEGWLNEIQKAGNRLYVKSAKGYLHIFEKN